MNKFFFSNSKSDKLFLNAMGNGFINQVKKSNPKLLHMTVDEHKALMKED